MCAPEAKMAAATANMMATLKKTIVSPGTGGNDSVGSMADADVFGESGTTPGHVYTGNRQSSSDTSEHAPTGTQHNVCENFFLFPTQVTVPAPMAALETARLAMPPLHAHQAMETADSRASPRSRNSLRRGRGACRLLIVHGFCRQAIS